MVGEKSTTPQHTRTNVIFNNISNNLDDFAKYQEEKRKEENKKGCCNNKKRCSCGLMACICY